MIMPVACRMSFISSELCPYSCPEQTVMQCFLQGSFPLLHEGAKTYVLDTAEGTSSTLLLQC